MKDHIITLNELLAVLVKLRQKGYGEAQIVLSDDYEWNGFRPLWRSQINKLNNDGSEDPDFLEDLKQLSNPTIDITKKQIILG